MPLSQLFYELRKMRGIRGSPLEYVSHISLPPGAQKIQELILNFDARTKKGQHNAAREKIEAAIRTGELKKHLHPDLLDRLVIDLKQRPDVSHTRKRHQHHTTTLHITIG